MAAPIQLQVSAAQVLPLGPVQRALISVAQIPVMPPITPNAQQMRRPGCGSRPKRPGLGRAVMQPTRPAKRRLRSGAAARS